ncbi:MAG: hypothetical protein H6767_03265 [Candidatus Peribacteria bacterium]|nr:MAG: hypothetical protein H6767_03265 [Candidatus Peribacteria bacterium]
MPKEFLSPPSPVDTVICDMQNRAADILRIQDGKYTQPYITSRIMEGTDGNGSSYRKKKRKMHNARTLWKEVKDNDYVSDDKRFEIRDILSEYLGDNFATKKVKGL